MGVVWLASHADLGSQVAIKVLRPEVLGDAEAVTRFDREARAAAVLRGPHVARILDVGKSDEGTPFMVMEYLEGCDLGAEILKSGALTVNDTVRWVLEACQAVSEAHARGIIHRDLKPENLFLTATHGERMVKLLDFGISRFSEGSELRVTQTQTSFGTPLYMSPEQVRSTKTVDHRTDIWALGVILYEALAGEPPFLGDTPTAVAVSVTVDKYVPIRKRRPDVPVELENIIAKALEKDPALRFQTVDELAGALAPLRDSPTSTTFSIPSPSGFDVADTRTLRVSSIEPHLVGAEPKRNRRLLVVGIVAGVAAMALLALVTVKTRMASNPPRPADAKEVDRPSDNGTGHAPTSEVMAPSKVDVDMAEHGTSDPVRAPTEAVVVGSAGPVVPPSAPSESAKNVASAPKNGVEPPPTAKPGGAKPDSSKTKTPDPKPPEHNPLIL